MLLEIEQLRGLYWQIVKESANTIDLGKFQLASVVVLVASSKLPIVNIQNALIAKQS